MKIRVGHSMVEYVEVVIVNKVPLYRDSKGIYHTPEVRNVNVVVRNQNIN
jgi:hypothetical protein